MLLVLSSLVAFFVGIPLCLLWYWGRTGNKLLAEEAERWYDEERAKRGLGKYEICKESLAWPPQKRFWRIRAWFNWFMAWEGSGAYNRPRW